jgi:hypothetical protein
MLGTYDAYGERCGVYRLLMWKNISEGYNLGDIIVDKKIILKWNLRKLVGS